MPLKIGFDPGDGEIHAVIRDGCKVRLELSDPSLSEYQKICAQQDGLRGFLLYENHVLMRDFHLEPEGMLRIYCPACSTQYIITSEEYNSALEMFYKTGKEWWQI